jgi:hypothetical protein
MTRLSRRASGIDAGWLDFGTFIADVGDRPSPRHRLFKIDKTKPYSRDNFQWKLTVPNRDACKVAKEWRENNPRRARTLALKRHFGITADDYDEMHERQHGLCAVCQKPERVIDKRTGKPYQLAVDHNHATGVIRGLLCANCNRAIGMLQEDTTTLRNAAQYLERNVPDIAPGLSAGFLF